MQFPDLHSFHSYNTASFFSTSHVHTVHKSRPDYHVIQQFTSKIGSDPSFRPFLAKYTKHKPVSYPPRPEGTVLISTHLSTLPQYFLHLSWLQATRTCQTPHLTRACGRNLREIPCQRLPQAQLQLQARKPLPPAAPARFTSTSTKSVETKAPICLQM